MSKRQVFRYTVPVDDQPHVIHLTNGATLDEVEFWAEHVMDAPEYPATFQVVGTGHPVPDGALYVGTCPRVHGLVWHLYRLAGVGDPR